MFQQVASMMREIFARHSFARSYLLLSSRSKEFCCFYFVTVFAFEKTKANYFFFELWLIFVKIFLTRLFIVPRVNFFYKFFLYTVSFCDKRCYVKKAAVLCFSFSSQCKTAACFFVANEFTRLKITSIGDLICFLGVVKLNFVVFWLIIIN